ncbi:hypothetical protein [Thermoleptolyngbya sp.]
MTTQAEPAPLLLIAESYAHLYSVSYQFFVIGLAVARSRFLAPNCPEFLYSEVFIMVAALFVTAFLLSIALAFKAFLHLLLIIPSDLPELTQSYPSKHEPQPWSQP